MVYHVDSHVASCSMEIHMVNHEVGMRCIGQLLDSFCVSLISMNQGCCIAPSG